MTVAQHGKIMACQANHFSMVNHKPQKTTYITLDGTRTVFFVQHLCHFKVSATKMCQPHSENMKR